MLFSHIDLVSLYINGRSFRCERVLVLDSYGWISLDFLIEMDITETVMYLKYMAVFNVIGNCFADRARRGCVLTQSFYDTIRITYVTVRFFSFFGFFCNLKMIYKQKEKGIRRMKRREKRMLAAGMILIGLFVIWTMLIQVVDVQPAGETGTNVGFATINVWFHEMTGVHLQIYTITDWLGLVPVFVCMVFGMLGFVQLIKRKSLLKVDSDIIALGVYYVLVMCGYLIFEMIPINYRPILIEGRMEASYPSSTTLLVLSVMPTLAFQVNRRLKSIGMKQIIGLLTIIFSLFMVIGRLISGVHWFTDIVGSILLSCGLFYVYKAIVLLYDKEEK